MAAQTRPLMAATPPDSGGGGQEDVKQRYCLKWNNYQSNVTTTFKELLAVEDFVDITLSAEGGALRAHKVVLSACSPYFRDILKGISAWQHPVIVLKDVPYEDLQGIVEFIYHGEVSVDKECLTSFLKTAQTLRVKGLTEESSTTTAEKPGGRVHSRKSSKPKRSYPFQSSDTPPPVPALAQAPIVKKPSLENNLKVENNENNEEEIDDVEEDQQEEEINDDEDMHEDEEEEEEEEVSPMQLPAHPAPHPFLASLSPESINAALALAKANSSSVELDEERKQRQQLLGLGAGSVSTADLMESELFASSFGYPPPLKNMLNLNGSSLASPVTSGGDLVQSSQASSSSNNSSGSLSQKKTCPYCYQQLSWHALSRHIRDMHKAKSNFVTCKFCQKMFRNKNSLGCHMWRFHKEAKEKEKEPMENSKVLDHDLSNTSLPSSMASAMASENP